MEKENSKYIKGFNHAYLIAKYKPELIKSIVTKKSKNDYIQGLKDGKLTFKQKRVKSRSQELHKRRSQKDRNRDIDIDRES